MKTVLILLAIVGFAAAAQIDPYADRSISSTVEGIIEGLRDQMECGFPNLGIPPLAPVKASHREINIDTAEAKLQGSVDKFTLNGLNDFDIAEMKVNPLRSKVTFRFVFNNVNVDTLYDLNVLLKKAGFTVNLVGNGPANFAVKDVNVWGTIKYSFSLSTRKLKLKTLEVRTHINDVESNIEGVFGEGAINHKLNDILAEGVELAINDNEQFITSTIERIALPIINGILDGGSVNELLVATQSDEGSAKTCVPQEF